MRTRVRRLGSANFQWQPVLTAAVQLVWAGVLFLIAAVMVRDGSTPARATGEATANFEVGASSAGQLFFPVALASLPIQSGPIYGVNFMSSAEDPADEQQYREAISTGASWNRWPLYWPTIEGSPEVFDWSAQDATVEADIDHGLAINAILLGTPAPYSTLKASASTGARTNQRRGFAVEALQAAAPLGLFDPVFSDGTDIPGPGKMINQANVWARFVNLAVKRYKPGGVLAQLNGWPAGVGITHWEMWNEPDLDWFWDSSLAEYARLLKVGFLATRQADPTARVLFGALANNFERLGYYEDVLQLFDSDPMAAPYGYFHDILATHSYFYAWQSWYHVWRAGNTMAAHGLEKPIWLNESGVAAWDDYPGPVWDPNSAFRASMMEQADYVIQSAFYAAFAGADAIFHFQLFDGCGNQPRGTDFPPHDGGLCGDPNYPICAGDANGLFRNPADAACFTQHPQPETPRPNYSAFRVLSRHLAGVEPLWRLRPGGTTPYNGPQELIAFYRPATRERIVGMWSRFGSPETVVITATNSGGSLIGPDGSTQTIAAANGSYTLQLPAATNQNAPWDPTLYPIGGRPVILVEQDILPPEVTVSALVHSETVDLRWQGNDHLGSGVADFDVSVSVDDGPLMLWMLRTPDVSGSYDVERDHHYEFFVVARDRAGNQSEAVSIVVVPGDAEHVLYLPAAFK